MEKATHSQITNWMNLNINEYIDHMTGEVCCTDLSEACAEHFGEDMEGDIPELYYDVAVDVECALLGNSFDNF